MKLYLLIFSLLANALQAQIPAKGIRPNPCDGKKRNFYKAEFKVMGSAYNGYLAYDVKRKNMLYVSFTSPMGGNLLEAKWKKGSWQKVHAIKQLGNKRMFNMLCEDLFLLLAHYQYDNGFEDLGNEWRWRKKKLIPHYDEEGRLLSVKVLGRAIGPSKTVRYSYEDACLKRMEIEHQGFPFSITLQPLDEK